MKAEAPPSVSGESSYRFAAFLSYRHTDPDVGWAKWLRGALERYRTPRELVRDRGIRPRVGRVFRDEEEVAASHDLSHEISSALEQSRHLIVLCSPRTPTSRWVAEEISRFRSFGRGERILAMLIEGEPQTSFPVGLHATRQSSHEGGNSPTQELDVEPLAADVRDRRGERRSYLRHVALLKLAAALLGCRFDELRRRDQERQRRRTITGAVALVLLAALFSLLAAYAFHQRGIAEQRSVAVTKALDEVLRLSDTKKALDLGGEFDDLWPLDPAKAPQMGAWVRKVEDLLAGADAHRDRLHALRDAALPYSDAARTKDEAKGRANVEAAEAELRKVEEKRRTSTPGLGVDLEHLRAELDRAAELQRKKVAQVTERAKDRRTWEFEDARLAWQHEVLVDLVEWMKWLGGHGEDQGRLADVRKRYEFASTLRQRSIGDHEERWRTSAEEVIASPRYAGLTLLPQVGLVPLSADPASGLQEFWVVGTGDAPVRDPKSGSLSNSEESGIVLVLVPGGTFWMGAQKTDPAARNYDPAAEDDEAPVHEVTLPAFFLAKHECTQAQWDLIAHSTPSHFDAGVNMGGHVATRRNPVESVSWETVSRWMGRYGLALPTEAQWEYACRAGTSTPWHCGSDVTALGQVGNILDAWGKSHGGPAFWVYTESVDDGQGIHAGVGTYSPNAFGLHDLHGNVAEWCEDQYYSYPSSPSTGYRINRGGAWNLPAERCRCADRVAYPATSRQFDLGFRAARPLRTQ